MRLLFCCILFVLVGCKNSKPAPQKAEAPNYAALDSIIAAVSVTPPVVDEALNLTSVHQLMESLNTVPFAQRKVTLKNIKDEALQLSKNPWPKKWDTKPIRSRYNVFMTHLSIATDQRFSGNVLEAQTNAIVKMKESWNIFAAKLQLVETSTVLKTAPR